MLAISELESEYVKKHSRSKQLYERALNCFASGVTHDGRYAKPFPIYMARADGAKKWDVDGNEYIDYVMGHGALLFGYNDERLTSAIEKVLANIHMGSCTELEIEWAEMIKKLVPCAKDGLVRAWACGGEAIMMAARLARIHTGKDKMVLHEGCYHGTWEEVNYGTRGPSGLHNARGIPRSVGENIVVIPYNRPEFTEKAFASGDIACIIFQGNAPFTKEYMEQIRELTTKYGVVFIVDEVVSGFRYAPGGAQEYYGVTPDLAVLGKIVGGGAPIGAICGSRDLLQYHEFRDGDSYWTHFVRIAVGGTWNAQPISIAAGLEAMKIIDKERNMIYPRLYEICDKLTSYINKSAEEYRLNVSASGTPPERPMMGIGPAFGSRDTLAAYAYYLSMANNGVYPFGTRFVPCIKHYGEDLEKTGHVIRETMRILKEKNLVLAAKS